jgi:hypothetical protein
MKKMSKTNLVAKIEIGFDADEIGRFESEYDLLEEDEVLEPRSREDLINYVYNEFVEIIYDAIKYNRIGDLIRVEEIG